MFDRTTFLIKERVGFLKLADSFDIYDPAVAVKIGTAREVISPALKLFRLLVNKRMLPTRIEVREDEQGPVLLSMRRGFNLFRARVTVHDRVGTEIGHLKSKFFSVGGGFHVLDAFENPVADIKGDWKGWNFRFLATDGTEIGKVTKKWAGLGKELFTSADNYVIALDEGRTFPPEAVALLLAAGLAIDIVYKEH
jgi:uncharacterized protein YxjI